MKLEIRMHGELVNVWTPINCRCAYPELIDQARRIEQQLLEDPVDVIDVNQEPSS
jgi:hypothetical protein